MGPMFFRPRPLKLLVLKASGGTSSGPNWLTGFGVLDSTLRNYNYFADRNLGDADQWEVVYPGMYRVEVIGGGGGGGGGDIFYEGMGYGGSNGNYVNNITVIRSSSPLRQGRGGQGGNPNSSYGERGGSGSSSTVAGNSAGGGSGGAGSTNSFGASEAQRQGEAGEVASDGAAYGRGGNGALPNSSGGVGGLGMIMLTLVG